LVPLGLPFPRLHLVRLIVDLSDGAKRGEGEGDNGDPGFIAFEFNLLRTQFTVALNQQLRIV